MTSREVDVLVVGAGPSGSAAAHDLASSGLRVLVVDRQSFPRHKACGGSLSKRTIDRMRYPVDELVRSDISRITITHGARAGTHIDANVPVVRIVSRYDLDDFLLRKAMAAGAEFVQVPRKLLAIRTDGTGLDVCWDGLAVRARWLVAADGANSQVRALLAGAQHQHACLAIEGDVPVPPDWRGGEARCDFGYAPHGYGWLVRKGGLFNVGLYTSASASDSVSQQRLKDYAREVFGLTGLENIKAAPVGTHAYRKPVVEGRVLFVGDAAGFADTLYGEGLHGALMSGQEAALCIAADTPGLPATLRYKRRMRFWQWRMGYIRLLSFCLYRSLPLVYPVFRRHFLGQWTREENLMRDRDAP